MPYSTFFACGHLTLPNLTHTLKNLPLPPWAAGNDTSHSNVVFWPYRQQPHPHIQGFTYVMQNGSLQPDSSSQR